VRSLSREVGKQDVCFVKMDGFLGKSLEFICVDGLLVGIPPKRRGEK
jgi:hypothetical protein